MNIPFTQFLLPSGRRAAVSIDVEDAEIDTLAAELLARGARFEVEMLRTGHVSLECCSSKPDEHGDRTTYAHEISDNGPPVVEAVKRLVREARRRIDLPVIDHEQNPDDAEGPP